MDKYYIDARGKEHFRGFFSYLFEHLVRSTSVNDKPDTKIYYDLTDIPNYMSNDKGITNIFNYAFIQDDTDFNINRTDYSIIPDTPYVIRCYDETTGDVDNRIQTELAFERHFKLEETLKNDIFEVSSKLDFKDMVGVHRRATDITMHHHIIPLERYFQAIDNSGCKDILLMCDNFADMNAFKERYGERIITYDTTFSLDTMNPYFKSGNRPFDSYTHCRELIKNVILLSKTNLLIKTYSNITSFCLLINKDLKYINL